MTDQDIAETPSINTAPGSDLRRKTKTRQDGRHLRTSVGINADLPRSPTSLLGTHTVSPTDDRFGRQLGPSPERSGCRPSDFERISTAGLHQRVFHDNRVRSAWGSGSAE